MLIRVTRGGAVVVVERSLLTVRVGCPDREILVPLPVLILECDVALLVEVEVRCVGDPLLPLLAWDRAPSSVEGVLGAMNVDVVAQRTDSRAWEVRCFSDAPERSESGDIPER